MSGRLKKIIDYVRDQSTLKNLALASMRLLVDEDVMQVDENTPDDPVKETRYLEAARVVLRRDSLDLDL